jgi:hypothetical protein
LISLLSLNHFTVHLPVFTENVSLSVVLRELLETFARFPPIATINMVLERELVTEGECTADELENEMGQSRTEQNRVEGGRKDKNGDAK